MANTRKVITRNIDSRVWTNTGPSVSKSSAYRVAGDQVSPAGYVDTEITNWNYRARIKAGLPTTSYMRVHDARSSWDTDGHGHVIRDDTAPGKPIKPYQIEGTSVGSYWGVDPQYYSSLPSGLVISESRANSQALIHLNKSITKAYQSIEGLVAIGELGEVGRMFRNRLPKLWSGVFNYLGDVTKRCRRVMKSSKKVKAQIVADTWLEYVFGWRPLISDIRSGAEALARSHFVPPPRIRIFGAAGDNSVKLSTFDFDGTSNPIFYHKYNVITRLSYNIKYYGAVHAESQDYSGLPLDQFGIRPWQVIPTIWELIPYSFLVDYFTNVGGLINSIANQTVNMAWLARGTETLFTAELQRVTLRALGPAPGATTTNYVTDFFTGEKGLASVRDLERQDWTELSRIPSFHFQIPGLGTKWLNIAALGVSRNKARNQIRGF